MSSTIFTNRFHAAALAAVIAVFSAANASAGVPATYAGDICPGACSNNAAVCDKDSDCSGGALCNYPSPCNVTQQYDITPGAVLDFKTSTLNVTGAGQFNFDVNSGKIRAGQINVSTASPAIDANGLSNNGTDSGTIEILARRNCDAAQAGKPVACVDFHECQLGSCNTRRCTGRPRQHCTDDANCVGTCNNRRCSNTTLFTRCTTNGDCNFGTCPQQLTCQNEEDFPVNCSTNTECFFGECSVGTASISMGGSIVGNSDFPASISMRAADNISISKTVNLAGSAFDSDGGDLTAEAAAGSVSLTANIVADSGSDGQGGVVEFDAGLDVTIGADINVDGGDFDGGSVEVNAGRDAFINKSLLADANAGEGYGGEILLSADRDMIFTGVSSFNRTTIQTSGHTSADNSAGDGGSQDYTAGRDLSFTVNTRMTGNGASPNGYGSDVTMDVGRNVVLDGGLIAKAEGVHGQGGTLDVFADGTSKVSATGTIDLTGGDSGGGDLGFESTGNMTWAGLADVSGGTGGAGGSTFLFSSADTSLSGTLQITSTNGGSHEVDACHVVMTGTGKMTTTASNGENTILARESIKLLAGSKMTAPATGKNELIYRTAAKPPLIQGTVTPAPIKTVNPLLAPCPICGNSEIDGTETCDDGNTANGDGCNSSCQNEKCVQQTAAPGFPTVPLCSDNSVCTTDTCNTALNGGTCQHAPNTCDDSIACTQDSCNPQTGCVNVANDLLCDDQNPCTHDMCSTKDGCTTEASSEPCSDNDACTENDVCVNESCEGTPIQGCSVCGNGVKTSDEQCDDGNAEFFPGEYCGIACVLIPCGKPTNSSGTLPKSSDALYVLKAAVNSSLKCDVHVCDADGSGAITAPDALRILRVAVSTPGAQLKCPAPPA